ncbi:MAG: DUF6011 domain-containing protein [Geodermatophilaceae bacterium]
MFIVGGAAMAFAYNTRRSTRDVDTVFEPKAAVYDAATAVANRRGIAPDWLNDAANSYLPGPDPDPDKRQTLDRPGLTVDVASPKYLLAMKLLAARDTDIEDIQILYAACGYTTAAQGLDLLEATYPSHLITPRVRYILEELYPEQADTADHAGTASCTRCGRPLRNPDSIARGMGPACASKT